MVIDTISEEHVQIRMGKGLQMTSWLTRCDQKITVIFKFRELHTYV